MAREYELWLDESGTFENERQNASNHNEFPDGFHPSLIGGWLVEHNRCHHSDLASFVIPDATGDEYHAAGMGASAVEQYIFPGMRAVHNDYGGKIVLFQNKELRDFGNRELYLRLMASGLLQLLQELNATSESVKLQVLIARRMDKTCSNPQDKEIVDAEYKNMLGRYIQSKKKEGHILLHEDTEMSITIDSGRKDYRLKVADYACNTELTLRSDKYTDANRAEFKELLKDAYVYSFEEDTTENSIERALTQGNVAGAMVETVFNTKDKEFSRQLNKIVSRLSNMGYRGSKVQLAQCTREFTTYVYMEDDFERSEEFLKKILDQIVPVFEEGKLPCEIFKFSMELLLTDMYLREGDIDRATEEMARCIEAESALPSSFENLLYYYQLIEKEALLAIDSFDFRKGASMMEDACTAFREIIEYVPLVNALKDRFPDMISEYYGDALCMKIYAELFLQRTDPDLYASLVKDSDIALKQYGPHEGELERHRQYRSVIELQNGNYEAAAKWLLMTELDTVTMGSLSDNSKLSKRDFDAFLKRVIDGEAKSARKYYLMYYIKIMAEAALAKDDIADLMQQALVTNPGIQETDNLQDRKYHTSHGTNVEETVITDLDYVIRPSKYIDFHPLEVNYWKQATYMFAKGNYSAAENLYKKAHDVCYTYSDYMQLAVIGLGIWAEHIVCLMDHGKKKDARKEYEKLNRKIEDLKKRTAVSSIKDFLTVMGNAIVNAKDDDEISRDKMWKASRLVTF